MTDIRRYSLAAVILLVVLRLAIGWQLLYEGLWKFDTLRSLRPWTSSGYLKNSVGPMRNTFRNMAGDPNELDWLDYEKVSVRWKAWGGRFQKHYRLDKTQTIKLNQLLVGNTSKVGDRLVFAQELKQLPDGVKNLKEASRVSDQVIWFDSVRKRLYVNAGKTSDVQEFFKSGTGEYRGFLTPSDKAKLDALVKAPQDADAEPDPIAVDYLKAVNTVYERQKKGLGYLRKLAAAVNGDPDMHGNPAWQRVGKVEEYRQKLVEYEGNYAKADTSFEQDHLQYTWRKIQTLRAELTGPVKAMEAELKDAANKLLTVDQRSRGPVGEPLTVLKFADTMTIIGLTALGCMLITGLFTRFAAAAAAFMLFNFYMAMPPFPGVPELPGPEHSFVVNKNLIEVFALLAIAALPTGIWFGLDGVLSTFFSKWRADKKISPSLRSTVATGEEPDEAPEVVPVTT
ncbi:MAG: hypothetical protein ABGZ24_14435 [Fuerstiella sp.]